MPDRPFCASSRKVRRRTARAAAQCDVAIGNERRHPRRRRTRRLQMKHGALPDGKVVIPVAIVESAVRHPQYARAFALVLAPFTGVFAAVRSHLATEAVPHVRHPRALVAERAADLHRAIAGSLALAPGTFVRVVIGLDELSVPVGHVVLPVAFVVRSVDTAVNTEAVAAATEPFSVVVGTVDVVESPLALWHVVRPAALIAARWRSGTDLVRCARRFRTARRIGCHRQASWNPIRCADRRPTRRRSGCRRGPARCHVPAGAVDEVAGVAATVVPDEATDTAIGEIGERDGDLAPVRQSSARRCRRFGASSAAANPIVDMAVTTMHRAMTCESRISRRSPARD